MIISRETADPRRAREGAPGSLLTRAGAPHLPAEGSSGIAPWRILDRRTVHVHDTKTAMAQRRYPGLRPLHSDLRTLLATPLLRDGVAVGLIIIWRARVRPFTAKQTALLRTFADQAAIALADRGRALLDQADRPAENLRRPGRHCHRERPPVHGARGPEPRSHRGAGAADRHERGPQGHQPIDLRPPARPPDTRRERHAPLRGRRWVHLQARRRRAPRRRGSRGAAERQRFRPRQPPAAGARIRDGPGCRGAQDDSRCRRDG